MGSSWTEGVSCLVDTDVAIDFLRGRTYARKLLDIWSAEGFLAISTLTHLEIYQGMKAGEEGRTSAFLDGLMAVAVDVPIARRAGRMLSELRSRGVTVGIADSVVAATASRLDVPLLTNNVQHYPFPELTVVRGLGA